MGELVKFIAQNLVDNADAVQVDVRQGEQAVIIALTVAPDDMGKVIGKHGRIAKAIRTVVKAASVKQNEKYIVEIV